MNLKSFLEKISPLLDEKHRTSQAALDAAKSDPDRGIGMIYQMRQIGFREGLLAASEIIFNELIDEMRTKE